MFVLGTFVAFSLVLVESSVGFWFLVVTIFGSILILKFELDVGISDRRQRERQVESARVGGGEEHSVHETTVVGETRMYDGHVTGCEWIT